ncbi:MAG TPA: thiamine pyrophosphate-dependent enzyme, partial [Burkholderiaceae bacterium]|nr:thiamine pyrophosphate-dependent enzyme [Burkholderiaceae bacterium]
YMIDAATAVFADCRELVLAGAKPPVAFFAYPGKPSRLAPDGCRISTLAAPDEDVDAALQALADALDANGCEPAQRVDAADRLPLPSGGEITPAGIGQTLAALLPENAVVIDEAVTTGRSFQSTLRQAAPHDWMTIMGGAIGCGLPLAVGAAVAAPDRKVVALEGDGSAMYTLQALWTMARESLDVTVLVFANRSYEILKGELRGVGATIAGDRARSILSLDEPALDWVQLARGQGVDATRATDLSQLATALQHGLASTGPYLIEVALRPS